MKKTLLFVLLLFIGWKAYTTVSSQHLEKSRQHFISQLNLLKEQHGAVKQIEWKEIKFLGRFFPHTIEIKDLFLVIEKENQKVEMYFEDTQSITLKEDGKQIAWNTDYPYHITYSCDNNPIINWKYTGEMKVNYSLSFSLFDLFSSQNSENQATDYWVTQLWNNIQAIYLESRGGIEDNIHGITLFSFAENKMEAKREWDEREERHCFNSTLQLKDVGMVIRKNEEKFDVFLKGLQEISLLDAGRKVVVKKSGPCRFQHFQGEKVVEDISYIGECEMGYTLRHCWLNKVQAILSDESTGQSHEDFSLHKLS